MDLEIAFHHVQRFPESDEMAFANNRYLPDYNYPADIERTAYQILEQIFNFQYYDAVSSTFTVDEVPFIQINLFRIDWRHIICRALQYYMYGNVCCRMHTRIANTYLQVLEIVLMNRDNWSDYYLDYGYNFALTNLYRIIMQVNDHLIALGKPAIYANGQFPRIPN